MTILKVRSSVLITCLVNLTCRLIRNFIIFVIIIAIKIDLVALLTFCHFTITFGERFLLLSGTLIVHLKSACKVICVFTLLKLTIRYTFNIA